MYYGNYYRRRFKDTPVLDPKKCNNIPVKQSLKIYFTEYPYKIKLVGDNVKHDIKKHVAFSNWFTNQTWHFRDQWTPQNYNIFLADVQVLYDACKNFPEMIQEVHGPISAEHLEQILDDNITTVVREKLWHNKYDVKYVFGSNSNRYSTTKEDRKNKAELTEFINSNYKDCKWYSNSKQGNWYVNYLFTTEKESKELLPFLKMSYNDLLTSVVRCKVVTENVLEEK